MARGKNKEHRRKTNLISHKVQQLPPLEGGGEPGFVAQASCLHAGWKPALLGPADLMGEMNMENNMAGYNLLNFVANQEDKWVTH